jgi:hypothetical protein
MRAEEEPVKEIAKSIALLGDGGCLHALQQADSSSGIRSGREAGLWGKL